jgi:inorganic phosphate transporter, PiT family
MQSPRSRVLAANATIAANRSGLQWSTIMSLASACVLTLPVAIVPSGVLFFVFRHLF